jgi:hypothetical protein
MTDFWQGFITGGVLIPAAIYYVAVMRALWRGAIGYPTWLDDWL